MEEGGRGSDDAVSRSSNCSRVGEATFLRATGRVGLELEVGEDWEAGERTDVLELEREVRGRRRPGRLGGWERGA